MVSGKEGLLDGNERVDRRVDKCMNGPMHVRVNI